MTEAIILFPGQGSQSIGMGKDIYEQHTSAREVFETADKELGRNLSEIIFNGPEEELTKTHNTQPAITTVNLAILSVLREKGITPLATAGHSLGEYSALACAGAFTPATAIDLTAKRGARMQACADRKPGSMFAIIGMDMDEVAQICRETTASGKGTVGVANYNSPEQVVITGETAAVNAAVEELSAKGAKRTIELKVSGPWHSPLMEDARKDFANDLAAADISDPTIPIYANVDAKKQENAAAIRKTLEEQITGSVLWTQTIHQLRADFPEAVFIECGPGKVLKGLLRKIDRDATCVNIECERSLAAALEKLNS